jgi:hypothetical protein
MRAHDDFSQMKGRKNPYVKLLKQPVTLRLERLKAFPASARRPQN